MKHALALLALAAALPAAADDLTAAGRPVYDKFSDAVVSVRIVLEVSMSMGGRSGEKEEQKLDISGTVVREDGLTVVSLAAMDPAEALMSAMRRGADMNVSTKVKDVQIRRPDGTEVPGRVVLRDKDLDLAVLAPAAKQSGWRAVDLAAAADGGVLEPVFVLQRLGQVAARAPAVSVGRITAVVEKPRRYLVMDHDVASLALGVPVFGAGGKVVGLVTLRQAGAGETAGMNALFSGASTMGMIPVIRPAAQVKEVVDQADTAQAEAAPAEAKPETQSDAKPAAKPADQPAAAK